MTFAIPLSHPYWFVRNIALASKSSIRCFQLSQYQYLPQTVKDVRESIEISLEDFINPEIIESIIHAVPLDKELAFHSLVSLHDGTEAHIPLVDMSTSSPAHLAKLRPFLGDRAFDSFAWYQSGRSFHGYSDFLVSSKQWASMLGALLLANQKGLAATVDPRWIGHRLIAGYSALRWTKNTSHYIALPKSMHAR